MPTLDLIKPRQGDIDFISRIYLSSFPPEEQRPWENVVKPAVEGCPDLKAIYHDGKAIGLLTTWEFETFIYVEHFAIDPSTRGGGIGSRVIGQLVGTSAKPVVLEVEPSGSTADAARRISFYERHGFKIVDREYVQPGYTSELPEVPLWLMATSSIDTAEVTRRLHAEVYGVKNG